MSGQLPDGLSVALDRLLEGVSRRQLATRAERLSKEYRKSRAAALRDPLDAIAYAVARMPATFAAVSAALRWTLARQSQWQPRSMLDLGSGPGTAIWAARELLPSLVTATAIERNPTMIELATACLDPRVEVTGIPSDLLDEQTMLPASDLVVAAYVLGELNPSRLPGLVERAFRATRGVLLLVEPGTPAGARTIGLVRSQLIAAGAAILAPCPHSSPCPMVSPGWCHFPARLGRTRAHMQVKSAVVPFEDEKFSYLAISRTPAAQDPAARIVGSTHLSRAGVRFPVCRDGRIEELQILKRDDAAFRVARKHRWGDET